MKNLRMSWLLLLFPFWLSAQNAFIEGLVKDATNQEWIEFATVYIEGETYAVETNSKGAYSIKVPAGKAFKLVFSRIGYEIGIYESQALDEGASIRVDISMVPQNSDLEIVIREKKLEESGMIQERVEEFKLLPSSSGNFESLLPHIALGTSGGSGGELSSQYNVRGGNYDENLVYVNDFEIYRPQLIRSSQQEGLSFPNIDLIRDLSFSSGGFEAKYGDKLSSVLDIKYKLPDSLKYSLELGALGASGHIEGSLRTKKDDYKRFRYLLGARYKTTRYLLGSLDVTGEYSPSFTDIQGYFTYDLSRSLQVGLLANYNSAVYKFVPENRSTALGLIDFALKLTSVFDGSEHDEFNTNMGGVSLTWLPDRKENPLFMKLLVSGFQSQEQERFDIIGAYRLSQVESSIGSENAGEEVAILGIGTQHQFVRNQLFANVINAELKGGLEINKKTTSGNRSHFLQWGLKYKNEYIFDKIKEWERIDSAGYSLEYDTSQLLLSSFLNGQYENRTNRISAYFQETFTNNIRQELELRISGGLRAQYWDLNQELLLSPRVQFLIKPLSWKEEMSFKLASGMYHQSPFYREMRGNDGLVNTELEAQKSVHLVAGWTWDFLMPNISKKKFRLIAEAYYKYLWDLVSYDVENVRIRYSGQNDATGYATGLDLRLNGEFVPGAESWINLSFLRTREKLDGIEHRVREVGTTEGLIVEDVPRPTDRLVFFSMFFQDYLPKNENFKMNLGLSFGTGMPFGLKDDNIVFRNTYRYKSYQRIDIGFSYQLWQAKWRKAKPFHFLRFAEASWISMDVHNLLKIQNVASNTWVKTIFRQQYAIPNYLTSRRINLRFRIDF